MAQWCRNCPGWSQVLGSIYGAVHIPMWPLEYYGFYGGKGNKD